MSPDLKLANIYVMPLGGADVKPVIAALDRHKKILRTELAHRVNLKFAPDLKFRVDERLREGGEDRRAARFPRGSGATSKRTMGRTRREPRERFRRRAPRHASRRGGAPAPPTEERGERLGRARQARRHDVDLCGVATEAPVQRQEGRPCGTLDPLASGLLPIAFGEATKTVPFVQDGAKSYRFRVRWGARTDSDDSEGQVVATSDARPAPPDIEALLPSFVGTILQRPALVLGHQGRRRARLRPGGAGRRDLRACLAAHHDPRAPSARREPRRGRARSALREGHLCPRHRARPRRSARLPRATSTRCAAPASARFAEADGVTLPGEDEDPTAFLTALRSVEAGLGEVAGVPIARGDAARLRRGQPLLLRGPRRAGGGHGLCGLQRRRGGVRPDRTGRAAALSGVQPAVLRRDEASDGRSARASGVDFRTRGIVSAGLLRFALWEAAGEVVDPAISSEPETDLASASQLTRTSRCAKGSPSTIFSSVTQWRSRACEPEAATVDEALRRLVRSRRQAEALADLAGLG